MRGGYTPGKPPRRVSGGRAGGRFNINDFKTKGGKIDYNKVERALRLLAVGALGASGYNMSPTDVPLDAIKKVYETMRPNESIKLKGGDTRVGMQDHFEDGPVNPSVDEVAFKVSESTRNKLSGAVGYTAKIHKTHYEYGRRPTTAVRQYSRLNGYEQNKYLDTQFADTYDVGQLGRAELSQATGFNQKQAMVFADAHVSTADIVSQFALSSLESPQDKIERLYGYIRNFHTRYQIMNVGTYFPSKVKIKVYRPTRPNNSPLAAITSAFPTSTQFANDTASDALPLRYVFSGYTDTSRVAYGFMDPRVSLDNSIHFYRRFRHLKTFSKTLKPGDVWDFKAQIHCGSGVRLDLIKEIDDANNNSLVGDLYVIEHHGVMCEGVQNDDNTQSVIGTSPSWLQIRFEKGHESVRATQNQPGSFNPTAGGGIDDTLYLMRSFQQKDGQGSNTQRRINFNVGDIANKGGGAGTVYIPVVSDAIVDYAQERSEAN